MNGFLRWAAATLVLAAVIHLATVALAPGYIMSRLMARIEKETGGPNKPYHPPRPDHTARRVVRPSPDLLYTLCVLDLSRGPVRITAPVPDTYWSLSLFAANTDNYFVINDMRVKSRSASVLVALPGTDITNVKQTVAVAPGRKGLALIRILIDSETRIAQLDALRRQAECTVVTPG